MPAIRVSGDVGRYLCGGQVPIKECMIYMTPPKVKNIMQFGEDDFLFDVNLLSADRKFINGIKENDDRLKDFPDFMILMAVLNADGSLKSKLADFFAMVFPDYEVSLTKNSMDFVSVSDNGANGQVNQFNFKFFSRTLKELFWPPKKSEDEYNPANAKAEEIARKLEKGRELASRSRGEVAGGKGSIFGLYASVVSIGTGVSVNVLYDYTPFQLYDAFTRYVTKVSYDFYMKIKTTPMMDLGDAEEPDQWIANLYEEAGTDE